MTFVTQLSYNRGQKAFEHLRDVTDYWCFIIEV